MANCCTMSQTVLYKGEETLQIFPSNNVPMKLTLPPDSQMKFAVLIPSGGGAGNKVTFYITNNGTEIQGTRVTTSGAVQSEWKVLGPFPVPQGQQNLQWITTPNSGDTWPEGVDPFYIGEVDFDDYPINLKLWCQDANQPSQDLTEKGEDLGLSEEAEESQDYYLTSFEDTSWIKYFLRLIPWIDYDSWDFITAPEQASDKVLNGKYSCKLVQRPPFGASWIGTIDLEIPSWCTHISVSFGSYALDPNCKIGYKTYFDGKIQDNKEGPVQVNNAWYRVLIPVDVPFGAKKFKITIDLVPLPNIPLNNALYMDDFAVDFGKAPTMPARTLVVSDLGGNVYGLNSDTGTEVWEKSILPGYVTASATVDNQVAYFGNNNTPGSMFALNVNDGSQIWKQSVPAAIDVPPAIVGNVVYAIAANGILYGFSRQDGSIVYQGTVINLPTGTPVTCYANIILDGIVYLTSSEGIFAYDIQSKSVKWSDPAQYVKMAPMLGEAGEQLYIFYGLNSGEFKAMKADTGEKAWSVQLSNQPVYTVPQVLGGLVIFGNDSGDLAAYNIMTGKQAWNINKGGRVRGFNISADRVYFASNSINGIFYCFGYQVDQKTSQWTFTEKWSMSIPGGIQAEPLVEESKIFFTAGDKNTYAIDVKTGGSVTWKTNTSQLSFVTPALDTFKTTFQLSRKYDKCCFLMAHNAYASSAYGWIYAQQSQSFTSQLNGSVRGFMLDIMNTKCKPTIDPTTQEPLNVCGPDIQAPEYVYFVHEDLQMTALAMLPLGLDAIRKLSDGLQEIKEWLDNNPNEVVTLYFESLVGNNKAILDQAFKDAGAYDMIFWANQTNQGPTGNWNVGSQGWPQLQWMVTANKRIVVFSDHRKGDDGYPRIWDYAVENDYGDDGLAPGCKARHGSSPLSDTNLHLFIMNYFVSWSVAHAVWYPYHYSQQNDYYGIMSKVRECKSSQCATRLPNFIAVDFYQRGNNGGPQGAAQKVDGLWSAQEGIVGFTDRKSKTT